MSSVTNINGATPLLIPISLDRVEEVRREILFGTITSITERVKVWIARLGGSAAGTSVGPFATAERAEAHGLPVERTITRIRYERDGEPVPGCGRADELDENLHVPGN